MTCLFLPGDSSLRHYSHATCFLMYFWSESRHPPCSLGLWGEMCRPLCIPMWGEHPKCMCTRKAFQYSNHTALLSPNFTHWTKDRVLSHLLSIALFLLGHVLVWEILPVITNQPTMEPVRLDNQRAWSVCVGEPQRSSLYSQTDPH